MEDNNLHPKFEELKDFARTYIKAQLSQYGMPTDDDSYVDGIVDRVLQNREEVQRIQQQLVFKKLIEFYKEKANLNKIEIDIDSFIEKFYSHQHHH